MHLLQYWKEGLDLKNSLFNYTNAVNCDYIRLGQGNNFRNRLVIASININERDYLTSQKADIYLFYLPNLRTVAKTSKFS